MKSFAIVFATVAATTLCGVQTARADQSAGTLVYNFTYSANQAIQARDSSDSAQGYGGPNANGGNDTLQTNGISHYGGTLTDKGTMTVDIKGRQADGGLIVSISEQGENLRKAPPATCVVYGNTNVICDPNKTVYTEEYTLLRFLGANFIDPNQIDPNKHWRQIAVQLQTRFLDPCPVPLHIQQPKRCRGLVHIPKHLPEKSLMLLRAYSQPRLCYQVAKG